VMSLVKYGGNTTQQLRAYVNNISLHTKSNSPKMTSQNQPLTSISLTNLLQVAYR